MDSILIDFTQDNILTILSILGLLKILATYSENNVDDEIVSYLLGIFKKK